MSSIAARFLAKRSLIVAASSAILLFLAYVVAHGTLRMFALGIAIALALPLGYLAIQRPLLFPFGLYVILVPIDDILSLGRVGTVNKLLGLFAFAALLFALIRRGELVKPSPSVLAWLAVGLWMGISGFWTIDPKAWNEAYITFSLNFLLYALVAITIANVADLELVATCVVVGGLFASALGLWSFIHGGPTLQGRLVLPGGNPYDPPDPNQYAAALLLPTALLLAASIRTRNWAAFLGNLSGLAMLLITIVLTGSRAGMLAAGVMAVYILFRVRRRLSSAILVAGAAAAVIPFGAWIAHRWSNAISSGGAGRADIWSVGELAFKDHWLLGSGFASFPTAFNEAVLRAPLVHYINWHRAPHDMLLSTAVELGVVGLILMVFVVVFAFRDLSLPSVDSFLDDMRFALQGALLAIFIDALFLDITNRKYVWLIFMMVALLRSTIISVAKQRRRTACATASSLTPARALETPKLSA